MITLKCGGWKYAENSNKQVFCDAVLGQILETYTHIKYMVKCPTCGQLNKIEYANDLSYGIRMEYDT